MVNISITEVDNNKTITANKDDRLIITLNWNPSTGYYWQASDSTAGSLEKIKHDVEPNIPGAAQKVEFIFKIEKSGYITLLHARPWNENQPSKLFYVTIKEST